MSNPTTDQIAAMRRIQIGIQHVYEATVRINRAINENNLTDVGVKPLPTFHLGDTIHSLNYQSTEARAA